MKAIIIDDEINAIKSLRWEIEHYTPQVQVIQYFESPKNAVKFLQNNAHIELVFLDIEMPEMNGFDFIKKFEKREFEVIFTTAYSEFALEALKNEAVDYLLKPIDSDDLIKAVEKVKKRNSNYDIDEKIKKTFSQINQLHHKEKIKISHNGKIDFIEPKDIVYLMAEGNYCHLYLENQKHILLTCKIKEMEMDLPAKYFFRVHKSYIINVDKITSYLKNDSYIQLNKTINVPLARSRKSEFLEKYL